MQSTILSLIDVLGYYTGC